MMQHRSSLRVAAIMLMLCAVAAAQEQAERNSAPPAPAERQSAVYEELPNFQKVNDRLYRGAQPQAGGLPRLAAMGVRTIINLRGADARARREEREAISLGLRYYNVPLRGFARPTDEQIRRVLAIIDAPDAAPVFVHCKRGADRTGTVIAVYRMTRDGWTRDMAQREADRHQMHWAQFEMRDYVADCYRERVTAHESEFGGKRVQAAGAAAQATRRTFDKSFAVTRGALRRAHRIASS